MTIFDLLFLLLALISVVTLITAAVLSFSNLKRAIRVLKWWAIGAAAYLAVAAAVAFALPLQTFHLGDPQCEDDWCLTVERAVRAPTGAFNVTLRLSSRARRIAQRNKNGLAVFLTDDRGVRYPAIAPPDAIPFDVQLQPGESVTTTRQFQVPASATGLGLIVGHEGWSLPVPLIIGREPYQKTVVLLPDANGH